MLSGRGSPSLAGLLGLCGSGSGDGGLLSGGDFDGSGVDRAGLGDHLSRGGSGLLTALTVRGLGGGIKPTSFSSRSQTSAVVTPDVELEGAIKTAIEQLEPLRVVTVAIVARAAKCKA